MKKIISFILILNFVFPTISFARPGNANVASTTQPNCNNASSFYEENKIVRVCNDVSDIICKDVKALDRRSCNESDEYIFSKNTSKMDIFKFAQGCFKSGVTSFTQFFTDFIPELLKGIWEATKSIGSLAYDGAFTEKAGLWSKMKGMYESTTSVAADIYEAVQENPGAYFEKIWSKITDVVGPMVANYDCLKPQRKVENICGFIAGWIVPPAMLAKILVKGIKEVKFLKDHGVFSIAEKGKLIKALEYAENRPVLTLKQYTQLNREYKLLGYSDNDIALLYKTGGFQKFKLSELQPLSTAKGRDQRRTMLRELEEKTATIPKVKAATKAPRPINLDTSSDYLSIPTTNSLGKSTITSGQIVERVIEDGKEIGYRVRVVDPTTGKVHEIKFTPEGLEKLKAKPATAEAAAGVELAIKKDGKFLSPEDEFIALEKEAQIKFNKEHGTNDLSSVDVKDLDFRDFIAAQQAVIKKDIEAKALREATAKPSRIEGITVSELGDLSEFRAVEAEFKILTEKAKAGTAPKVLSVDQVKKGNGAAFKYENGVDYIPTSSPGMIVKTKQPPVSATAKPMQEGKNLKVGPFETPYIQVLSKNSMGVTSFMPAEIIKKRVDGGSFKYVIRVLDRSSNSYREQAVTLNELKTSMKARSAPKIEKEIKEFNRQTGFNDKLD
jgi:hypothetical protein